MTHQILNPFFLSAFFAIFSLVATYPVHASYQDENQQNRVAGQTAAASEQPGGSHDATLVELEELMEELALNKKLKRENARLRAQLLSARQEVPIADEHLSSLQVRVRVHEKPLQSQAKIRRKDG